MSENLAEIIEEEIALRQHENEREAEISAYENWLDYQQTIDRQEREAYDDYFIYERDEVYVG